MFWEMCNQRTWTDRITPTIIEIDSTAAIDMAKQSDETFRANLVDIKYHYVKDLIQGEVKGSQKVSKSNQVKDFLTKVTGKGSIEVMKQHFGLQAQL